MKSPCVINWLSLWLFLFRSTDLTGKCFSKAGLKIYRKLVKAILVSVSASVVAQLSDLRCILKLSLLVFEKSLDLVLRWCFTRLMFLMIVKLMK
jgi:hypothetical protein